MSEEEIARTQAHLLRRAIQSAGLDFDRVWLHYFSLGGEIGMLEVDAYLNHAMTIPQLQRDMLAHAVNELIDFTPSVRAPYTSDLTNGDGQPDSPEEDSDHP